MLKILCLRYAKKHGLPVLENVCLPRLGVAKTILDELAPNAGIHVFFYFIIFFFVLHTIPFTKRTVCECKQLRWQDGSVRRALV